MIAPAALTPARLADWLLVLCGMIFAMVVIGGLTRLTHSGLSMVEWQPQHVLPPMSDAEWRAAFEDYRLLSVPVWLGPPTRSGRSS